MFAMSTPLCLINLGGSEENIVVRKADRDVQNIETTLKGANNLVIALISHYI